MSNFSEYLTPANIALVLSLLLALESAWAKLYPTGKIATTVENGKTWIRTYAPIVSALVEELANTGVIPKDSKAREYVSKLEYEWAKAHPTTPMPAEAKAEALLIGEAAKVAFPHAQEPAVPAPANPPPAPASH